MVFYLAKLQQFVFYREGWPPPSPRLRRTRPCRPKFDFSYCLVVPRAYNWSSALILTNTGCARVRMRNFSRSRTTTSTRPSSLRFGYKYNAMV